jgi:hypothetical protein
MNDEGFLEAIASCRDDMLTVLAPEYGLPRRVLRQIITSFGQRNIALDPLPIERLLLAKAEEYQELRERRDSLTSDDPRVQALRREATALIADGAFESAAKKFSEAERIDLIAIDGVQM